MLMSEVEVQAKKGDSIMMWQHRKLQLSHNSHRKRRRRSRKVPNWKLEESIIIISLTHHSISLSTAQIIETTCYSTRYLCCWWDRSNTLPHSLTRIIESIVSAVGVPPPTLRPWIISISIIIIIICRKIDIQGMVMIMAMVMVMGVVLVVVP